MGGAVPTLQQPATVNCKRIRDGVVNLEWKKGAATLLFGGRGRADASNFAVTAVGIGGAGFGNSASGRGGVMAPSATAASI